MDWSDRSVNLSKHLSWTTENSMKNEVFFFFKFIPGHPKNPRESTIIIALWNHTSGDLYINKHVSEDGDLQATESM